MYIRPNDNLLSRVIHILTANSELSDNVEGNTYFLTDNQILQITKKIFALMHSFSQYILIPDFYYQKQC